MADKFCFTCGVKLIPGAAFCGGCGKNVAGKGKLSQPSSEKAYENEALKQKSFAAYRALEERICIRAKKNRKFALIALAVAGICGYGWYFLPAYRPEVAEYHYLFLGGGFISLLVARAHYTPTSRWLFKSEYYSLPGSQFEDGGHRCIYCGAKGIWRKGQYGSDNTYARCSKCQESLFVE